MGRKDLIEKVMLEERSKERKGTIYVRIWCKWYVASVWLVQEEPRGRSRWSANDKWRRRAGRTKQGLTHLCRDSSFYPQ